MFKISTTITALAILFVYHGHQTRSMSMAQESFEFKNEAPKQANPFEASLVGPLMRFSSKMVQALGRDKQNFIISPYSIHSALSMLAMGSSNRQSLLNVLGTDERNFEILNKAYMNMSHNFEQITKQGRLIQSSSIQSQDQQDQDRWAGIKKYTILDFWTMLVTAGGLSLNESYVSRIEEFYRSKIKLVDPANSQAKQKMSEEINDWAKQAGFAKQIIAPSDFDTDRDTLQLFTAVQVQSFWDANFNLNPSATETFYNFGLKNKLVDKPQLSASYLRAKYLQFAQNEASNLEKIFPGASQVKRLSGLNFRAIVVPLVGQVTFTILEPTEEPKGLGNQLTQLENHLLGATDNTNLLAETLDLLDSSQSNVIIDKLRMPAFKFDNKIQLDEPLKSMGLQGLFDGSSQLNGIANKPLRVSEAKHDAMIEVDKFGLKAAAVTRVVLSLTSSMLRSEALIVEVKNPFLFVTRYNKLPLFIGHLVEL